MIRYSRLGYIALNVSDLDRSLAFYRDVVGLQEVRSDNPALRLLRCSDQHQDIALYQGEPGVKRIAFELESAAILEPMRRALRDAGHEFIDIPQADRAEMGTGEGIRTWEPGSGCTLDFYVGTGPAFEAYEATVAAIERLGHIVIASREYDTSLKYFLETLNFRASDSFDGAVTFMRCFPSPYHHSLGVGNGKKVRNGVHHVAFMVNDIDDIGRSYWRLQKAGVPVVHGPGRHLPSGSVFLYFLDPDGLTIEYTLGMEEFPEDAPREPRALPFVPESNDIWASAIDKRKGATGTIEQRA